LQKLVTIYLDSVDQKGQKSPLAAEPGCVAEHLKDHLSQGWSVVSMFGLGGTTDARTRGWLAVVLEKD
jgi:hypothetical protein